MGGSALQRGMQLLACSPQEKDTPPATIIQLCEQAQGGARATVRGRVQQGRGGALDAIASAAHARGGALGGQTLRGSPICGAAIPSSLSAAAASCLQ